MNENAGPLEECPAFFLGAETIGPTPQPNPIS